MRQLLLDFTRAPAPTFENFVPGGNAELLQALQAAARGDSAERRMNFRRLGLRRLVVAVPTRANWDPHVEAHEVVADIVERR